MGKINILSSKWTTRDARYIKFNTMKDKNVLDALSERKAHGYGKPEISL